MGGSTPSRPVGGNVTPWQNTQYGVAPPLPQQSPAQTPTQQSPPQSYGNDQYGNPIGTQYAGGNPNFDERTGQFTTPTSGSIGTQQPAGGSGQGSNYPYGGYGQQQASLSPYSYGLGMDPLSQ